MTRANKPSCLRPLFDGVGFEAELVALPKQCSYQIPMDGIASLRAVLTIPESTITFTAAVYQYSTMHCSNVYPATLRDHKVQGHGRSSLGVLARPGR